MIYEIKNRFTGETLFSAEAETLRDVVLLAINGSANLRSADLSYANLSYANLSSANLSYANLSSANLRSAKQRVIRINGSRHEITSIDEMVFVGCIHHTIAWWMGHYLSVGKKEGYSESQITEYGMHLAHIEALLKLPWPQEQI